MEEHSRPAWSSHPWPYSPTDGTANGTLYDDGVIVTQNKAYAKNLSCVSPGLTGTDRRRRGLERFFRSTPERKVLWMKLMKLE